MLTYLVLAKPRGLHSRDTLVAMLWPESDQAGGRHALRNVLHAIRQALGNEIVSTAGDGMVGVSFKRIDCDAIELEEDLEAGRIDSAIRRYHGELLQGFHVSEAPEFERWLDSERRRLSDAVLAAAWLLADTKLKAGEIDAAQAAARRAASLAPDDEVLLRRFLRFLDDVGDRFGAERAYEEFSARLKQEYGADPSAETQALARQLRESPSAARVRQPIATAVPLSVTRPASEDAPVPLPLLPSAARKDRSGNKPRFAKWLWAAGLMGAVSLTAFAVRSRAKTEAPPPAPSKLVVLPMDNETGDPALDYIGTGLAEGIATRLEGIGGITVRSGARSDWPAATRHDFKTIGREFGSVILLKTSLHRANDSLEVRASILDIASSREKILTERKFTSAGLRDMESELAASVAGAVFRVALPAVSRVGGRPIHPESYRLMLSGLHELATERKAVVARELFLAAIRADPMNARAWSGLSSSWLAGAGGNPVGENLDEVEAAAMQAIALDSLQGTALANLGLARAFRYRNLADGLDWIRKAIAADPSNSGVFFSQGALYRHAWMWDKAIDALRIAQRLDPLSPLYIDREAHVELCAGRPERALPLYRRELGLGDSDTSALNGIARSLAMLGRYDEAIATWRKATDIAGEAALSAVLAGAKGKSGYASARLFEGRQRLAALKREPVTNRVRMMHAHFAGGDVDGGFADLDALMRQRSIALYRLPCMPDLDAVRDSPRLQAVLRQVGPLPQR